MDSSRILTWKLSPTIVQDGNKDSRPHLSPHPHYNSHPQSHSHPTSKPRLSPPPSPQKSRPKFWTEIPRSSRPNYNLHSPDSEITSSDDGLYISDVYKPPKPDSELQHHNQQQRQQQGVPKPVPAPNGTQLIPTKEWLSSIKARIADPIKPPPPPPPTPRPLNSFDAHVKATLRRLNRYIDKTGPQLPPSDNSSDSDNNNDPPRIKKDKNRSFHGPKYEPYKDMRRSQRGIKESLPPHLQPHPQPQTQTQAEPTEPPDADVGAVLSEMSGSDEDLNKYIYNLRKESCERLASAWQSIFDRFGNSDIEEGSEVDFAVRDYIPKSKGKYGRRKRHKFRPNAKPRSTGESVFKVQDSDYEEDIYSSQEEEDEEDEDDGEGEGEEIYEDDDEEREEEEVYESLEDLETEEEEEYEGARRRRIKMEEDEEKFVKASTDRLRRFLKDDDEDQEENEEEDETVRVWRSRIKREQQDEEGNAMDTVVVVISDSSDPPSPSRHRTRTHKRDRLHHNHHHLHYRRHQDQEEQDRSDRHNIPRDRHHHHGDSSRLFNLFDSPDIDHQRKEKSRVSGSDVDIQAKPERRYSHSGKARHSAREDEEAAAKGAVVEMEDYQTGSHRWDEDDSMDTFNFGWDQPRSGPLPKPGSSDLMIARRAFNKWRWYSASRRDFSARSRDDPQEVNGEEDVVKREEEEEEEVDDEEEAYDGDESDTEVEQEYQCIHPRRQLQQQQQQQLEEEFPLVVSPTSPTATKGLTSESTALYNRSGTMRLHMMPQTRALAAALSPRKRVPPTPLRLLNTASGLNSIAAGDSSWRLSDADGMRPSPPPFSASPSPTGNLWSSDAFPGFSAPAAPRSPMTTPRKRQSQQPPVIDLTTPKAQRFMPVDDLYRLRDEEHESVSFSNPGRTAEQYTRLIIPTTPPSLPSITHQQDDGFFDSPPSPPPPTTTATASSSSVEALYKAATESEFTTSTFLPRQQLEGPPVLDLALDKVDEELLREMTGLSTAIGTPRKSRVVVDPAEARLMAPKTKALASLLMSKKKIPSSPSRPAAGTQSPALVSDSIFGSGAVSTLGSTVTVTPPISSSATTPNPSISPSPPPPLPLPQPPLPSRSAAGAGASLFQMHTEYPMGVRGTKRQYGQDDDEDDANDGDDDDGLESFKVVKSESRHGIFHSPRPLS
ncbi:MAG: hypothetical protein JOS17DRAFT_411200 [Linnemannia elongata]|nr:MAG: hypothetical protein JOS17DRAFT_411200 [Linnemannia elongata]